MKITCALGSVLQWARYSRETHNTNLLFDTCGVKVMLCHKPGDIALETGFILNEVGEASTWEILMSITRIKVNINKQTLAERDVWTLQTFSIYLYAQK